MQTNKEKELLLRLDVEGLTPTQVRLIKSIHSLLANLVAADEEAEYFEMSSQLMKKTAEAIKHSSFPLEHKSMNYGEQAVEFGIDSLNEAIVDRLKNLDN